MYNFLHLIQDCILNQNSIFTFTFSFSSFSSCSLYFGRFVVMMDRHYNWVCLRYSMEALPFVKVPLLFRVSRGRTNRISGILKFCVVKHYGHLIKLCTMYFLLQRRWACTIRQHHVRQANRARKHIRPAPHAGMWPPWHTNLCSTVQTQTQTKYVIISVTI